MAGRRKKPDHPFGFNTIVFKALDDRSKTATVLDEVKRRQRVERALEVERKATRKWRLYALRLESALLSSGVDFERGP